MKKITSNFILHQYRSGVESYADFTKEVGLWASERYIFEKYLNTTDYILDLGCGTGRTTFPLFQLGYENIVGVDLTPEMIVAAQALNQHFNTSIDFQVGDATQLNFENEQFDSIIFSFNGLMSIPSQSNRDQALAEIQRVLKKGGYFLFTTHDRNQEPQFFDFWKSEAERWKNGQQNPKLYDFGDLITSSKNESREIFIHIPSQASIANWLVSCGFEVVETFYRREKFDESDAVKAKSGECRFWVARKMA